MSQAEESASRRALFVALLTSLLVVLLVLRPLAVSLFLAGVLGAALWPAHQRLCRALRGRNYLAGGVLILLVMLLVLTPITALAIFVVRQSIEAATFVSETLEQSGMEGLLERLPDRIEALVRKLLGYLSTRDMAELSSKLQTQLTQQTGAAAKALGAAVSATGAVLFQWVMMLIALFFFLTNKEALFEWVDDASPLGKERTHELAQEFKLVTGAVLRSSMLTALVQAVAAVIGYYIVSLPSPVFFGAVTFVLALVPVIGAAAVCLFAAALLLLAGHPISALFLTLWGLLVVGLVDNLVKPWLIKGEVQLHGAVVFFALIGGLAAFGAIGLLLGPLAISLFIALLRIYRREHGDAPG